MSLFDAEERAIFNHMLDQELADRIQAAGWFSEVATVDDERDTWHRYAQLGWLGLCVPGEAGGMGGGQADLLPILRMAGRGLLTAPLVPSLVMAPLLMRGVDAPAHVAMLRALSEGTLRFAFARGESLLVTDVAGQPLLQGVAQAVVSGHSADMLIVVTPPTGEQGWRGYLVDLRQREVCRDPAYFMIDNRMAVDIRFEAAPACYLANTGDGEKGGCVEHAFASGMVAVAAEMAGAMEELNTLTLDYVKIRQQFGQPLASFQVLQHRLVDMMIAQRQASAMVAAAVEDLTSQDGDWWSKALMCKAVVGRAARFVGEQAIQLHGGIGMTEECAVAHFVRRLLADEALFATTDMCCEMLTEKALLKDAERRFSVEQGA